MHKYNMQKNYLNDGACVYYFGNQHNYRIEKEDAKFSTKFQAQENKCIFMKLINIIHKSD